MFTFQELQGSRDLEQQSAKKCKKIVEELDEDAFEKLETFVKFSANIPGSEFEIIQSDFKMGGYGILHLAKRDEKKVVIKAFIEKIADDVLTRECFPMVLNHPFIRQVFGVTEIEYKKGVVMEYCDAVLEDMIPELSLKEKLVIMMQVSSALEFCHEKGIMHRDLKPNNVLLRRGVDGLYTPAIADFGLVRDASRSSANSMMGAARYAAPELANEEENIIGTAVDAWSFGVMLAQVVSGFVPFEGLSELKVIAKLIKKQLPYGKELLDAIPVWNYQEVFDC
eukprot:TRINITY_DN3286_c1_g3_i1.p1 TRINITY_DN3286_c1_g3~~TRINITY_DN3286_c1_g3_i1.p1  ORF type:complete len:281 (+),score=70.69 TRINITY_DN3286_c1_g3_i1:134-976(+)